MAGSGRTAPAVRPIPQLFLSGSLNYDDARQQSGLTDTTTKKPHINRVPSPKQTIRASYTTPALGAWTVIWRHEGHTTTLQGVWLDPFTVVDANVQREILPGMTGFVSAENVGDTKYQVNVAGTGATALISYGMPRTLLNGGRDRPLRAFKGSELLKFKRVRVVEKWCTIFQQL